MSTHIIDGEFQSDKYPTCPRGKVPLSVKDPTAQDLLWEYAQRRREVDAEFADDLEAALKTAGFAGGDSRFAGGVQMGLRIAIVAIRQFGRQLQPYAWTERQALGAIEAQLIEHHDETSDAKVEGFPSLADLPTLVKAGLRKAGDE